jgi:hypothetical protein
MPWTIYHRDRRLEVDLARGVRGPEWEELLDDIVLRLNTIERVIFLIPWNLEQGDQSEHLDRLVEVLLARGVNVERRHLG